METVTNHQPKSQDIEQKISMNIPETVKPRIVIIGGGFGGIEVVKTLGKESHFQMVLFDRHNYHTFQPLLYQVATAGLEPDSIASPLRKIFEGYKDFYFRMAEVKKVIPEENSIDTSIGKLKYDYLIIATGSRTNYYGNTELRKKAFPMKQVPQALDLRSKILQNFEHALLSTNKQELNSLLDIVIVGGGATGVELAGALSELKRKVLPKDLPEIDFKNMDIMLIENGPKLLAGMSENASNHALKYLQEFGVNIKLNTGVLNYDGYTVKLKDGSEIYSQTVIWAAGVMGNILEGFKPESVKASRYLVDSFNKVTGYKNIFAIGDPAAMVSEKLPKGHPMLAQVALQQGKNLGKNLKCGVHNKNFAWKTFSYHDKGSMATIGRNRAVVDLPNWKFAGIFAWFTWMFVHLLFLVGFRNKITTLINWIWNYFTFDRATRLIIRPWVKAHNENREE
jgi:NADH:ubiquinone reductase (H+-translocating)